MITNNLTKQAFKGTVKFENQTAETQTNWDGELQKIFARAEQNGSIQLDDQTEIRVALKLASVPMKILSNLDLLGKSVKTKTDGNTFTATVGNQQKPYFSFSCDA